MELSTLSWVVLAGSAAHGITCVCAAFSSILLVATIICLIVGYNDVTDSSSQRQLKIGGVLSAIFGIIFGLVAAFIPSEKAIYMVAGIELVNKFSKTEAAKELGDSGMSIVKDITDIIHNYTLDPRDRDYRR
jgi:hypothetical protein